MTVAFIADDGQIGFCFLIDYDENALGFCALFPRNDFAYSRALRGDDDDALMIRKLEVMHIFGDEQINLFFITPKVEMLRALK